jgi:hypothetical protein
MGGATLLDEGPDESMNNQLVMTQIFILPDDDLFWTTNSLTSPLSTHLGFTIIKMTLL